MDYERDEGVLRSMVNKEANKCYKNWMSDLHDHLSLLGGGAQNQQAAKNNPLLNLGIQSIRGSVATDLRLVFFG